MAGASAGARKGLRWGILALAVAFAIVAIGADPADARRRKKFRTAGYNPPYAAIVVDVNSGATLHERNANSIRHPASLTKVMTLYLLFEQIEAGKLALDSELPVSANAASQPPTKLGLRPGQTISAEDAMLALITKSANDAAVVIAEAIGGDVERFARLMTRKARSIGMSRTIYTNPSGLPDVEQVTTARDQAILGRAIQDRFPRYYRYFSTARFTYRGRTMGNHNRLLGRVPGVDGIKTGFIRASGFNLISSMRRDGRHVVAVVIGGRSGRVRDAQMRTLLERNIVEASVRRTTPKIVEVAEAAPAAGRAAARAAAVPERAAPRRPLVLQAPAPAPGSADPIRPIIVRTMNVRSAMARVGSVSAAVQGAAPVQAPGDDASAASPAPAQPVRRVVASAGEPAASFASEARSRTITRGEWVIQVGALATEAQAHDRLKEAKTAAGRALARAEPFTERIVKGETTLFRARFAGFNRDSAQAACDRLKRNEIACLALKN